MPNKIIFSDVHITDEVQLHNLESFLANIAKDGSTLCFIGNGVEFVYDQNADRAMKLLSERISHVPGSIMVRGNHEDEERLFLTVSSHFDFSSLPIFARSGNVVIAHNADNLRNLDKKTVSEEYLLTRKIMEREVALHTTESVEPVKDRNEIGRLETLLFGIKSRRITIPENEAYLKQILATLNLLNVNLAFVGHEHNIDRDTTIFFELGRAAYWNILRAGDSLKIRDDREYLFVTPHFRGALHSRLDTGGDYLHYLEYALSAGTVTYKKYLCISA